MADLDERVIRVLDDRGRSLGFYTGLRWSTGELYLTDADNEWVLRYSCGQACGEDMDLLRARGLHPETAPAPRVRET